MEQLSSCYFCGAALDASLDEYPVVPKSLHPDDDEQKTVVLCQGCRRKLGTVVETVVSVVESPETSRIGTESPSDAAESPTDAGGVAAEDPVDASELSSEDVGDASTDDDGTKDVTYTTSTAAGGRKSVSGEAESIRDAGGATDGTDGGPADTDETASGGASGDGDGADDGPSLTALENTKVMRLLQNRAFPVDREEIRTVAVNAYDISESQFDAVVDAAVDKGLIDERNGQFVEAE